MVFQLYRVLPRLKGFVISPAARVETHAIQTSNQNTIVIISHFKNCARVLGDEIVENSVRNRHGKFGEYPPRR